MAKAIILVGGPSTGTRFRPLSFDVPKPLFPIAGKPMLHHHIEACAAIAEIDEIFLLGFFDKRMFEDFISSMAMLFSHVTISYLQEPVDELGTAGGLLHFGETLLATPADYFLLLHCDVCFAFSLAPVIAFHNEHSHPFTMVGTTVDIGQANGYGCVVEHVDTHEVLHYVEKPCTFVNNVINCGVYVFQADFLNSLPSLRARLETSVHRNVQSNAAGRFRLEQDVLSYLAGRKSVYLYHTTEDWAQCKSAGAAVRCGEIYLRAYRKHSPQLLYSPERYPRIPAHAVDGDVVIHPSAFVHPTAKIGPSVSIGVGARIGAGSRVSHSIILDGVEILENAVVRYSVLGWNSSVGKWARIEGTPSDCSTKYTIFGIGVTAHDEVVIRNSIVLPLKNLYTDHHNEILL